MCSAFTFWKKESTAAASWWDWYKGVNVKRQSIMHRLELKIIWCFKITQQRMTYIWMFWSSKYGWLVSISNSCNHLYLFIYFFSFSLRILREHLSAMPPAFCHKADLFLFCLGLRQRIKMSYHLPQWASDGFKAHICAECCSLPSSEPWTHWTSKGGKSGRFWQVETRSDPAQRTQIDVHFCLWWLMTTLSIDCKKKLHATLERCV